MIAIINTGNVKDGKNVYRLQINDKLVCGFEHDRSEGLTQCLRDAASAVDRAELDKWIMMVLSNDVAQEGK